MKVFIDQDKCVASGQCVTVAPDVFDQRDEDGIAAVIAENPADGLAEAVRQAATICPAVAITVEN